MQQPEDANVGATPGNRAHATWFWACTSLCAVFFAFVAFPFDRAVAARLPAGNVGHAIAILLALTIPFAPLAVIGSVAKRGRLWLAFLRAPRPTVWVLLPALGVALLACAYAAHFGRLNPTYGSRVVWRLEHSPDLAYIIGAVLPEEIAFRGVALVESSALYGATMSVLFSSCLFALAHLPRAHALHIAPRATAVYMTSLFLLGLFLAIAARQTKSVWTSVALHSAYNVFLAP